MGKFGVEDGDYWGMKSGGNVDGKEFLVWAGEQFDKGGCWSRNGARLLDVRL